MVVGIAVFELHIPEARSLKDKRKVLKGLIDRVHRRFRISIAETDMHELHQRSEVCLAIVGTSERESTDRIEELRRVVEENPDIVVTSWQTEQIVG